MRIRIASIKATQKITKAMQMVAASKLRRAQTAAEAARPYAEQMDAVIANLAGAAAGRRRAACCSPAPARTRCICCVVCTGERGLSGAFNSSIVRLARERAAGADRPGQRRSRFFCVGRKGYEQLRRQFDKQIVEHRRPARRCASSASSTPRTSPRRSSRVFEAGEFDVCTLFYSRFKSVIAQIPTAQQLIPLVVEAPAANAGAGDVLRIRAGRRRNPDGLLPRNLAVQIFRALLENNASFYGAQMSAMDNATRNAGDMIKQADPDLQPHPSGA